jgi:tetratricopeptide (TPR) repeat protein
MNNPVVFISYSHDSDDHREQVLALSERLRSDGVETRLDQYLNGAPEEGWPRWMLNQLDDASFVLVICTETYYRRFRGKEEPGKGKGVDWEGALITLELYNARSATLKFVPVLFSEDQQPFIPEPLRGMTHYQVTKKSGYESLYDFLLGQAGVEPGEIGEPKRKPRDKGRPLTFDNDATSNQQSAALNSQSISIARLPQLLTRDLFGREKELLWLDDVWANPATNVVTFVAWGGVGKTALINHWVRRLAARNYDGAERVYAWSFYSQGTSETQAATAEYFVNDALGWFGDPDPAAGSPWDKGERLAHLIRAQRTLLVLDGLEPLQQPPNELGLIEGRLKEQSMQALLRELAAGQPGLCVISTRVSVAELEDYESATLRYDLDQLAPEAGAQLLRKLGVAGGDDELEQAAKEFGGHSLALTLLGGYLNEVFGGDVRRRREIEALTADARHGGHAHRVMASYEKWLGDGPELAVLRLLGLFDRPADAGSIAALRAAPVIPGLTDALRPLSEAQWQQTLAKLRRIKLLAERPAQAFHQSNQTRDELDAHPLVREYFRQRLQQTAPDAWREANNRLCGYLAKTTEEFPNTLNEMIKLFAAVAHGCEAGRHQEMWDEIYFRRIQRGEEFFSTRILGAFDSELAMLISFFEERWHKPVVGLRETTKASLLSKIGIRLIALGQPIQAIDPLRTALSIRIADEQWKYAAINASSLSEACSVIGSLHDALTYARRGVELADQSGDVNQKSGRRAILASVLHRLGNVSEASLMFCEAEEMQKRGIPYIPFLYSLIGFMYCDLLLDLRRYQEVQVRADWMLKLAMQKKQPRDVALSYLSLGRAFLIQIQQDGTDDYAQAKDLLNRAYETLKRAGQLDFMPLGILARAALYRLTGDHLLAQRDLDEAQRIATRGSLRLHEADCHLESARLALATGDRASARKAWEAAKAMVEEMGYHRRDEEVKEIERQLKAD